jgi:hypothetical protein
MPAGQSGISSFVVDKWVAAPLRISYSAPVDWFTQKYR